mmetsp:Transcript_30772/g.46562  ORF Transcript_30772/g.46562 Transcript_30772/m.46562 type:complete len:609 (+) Transcript_30772:54-1880(+)
MRVESRAVLISMVTFSIMKSTATMRNTLIGLESSSSFFLNRFKTVKVAASVVPFAKSLTTAYLHCNEGSVRHRGRVSETRKVQNRSIMNFGAPHLNKERSALSLSASSPLQNDIKDIPFMDWTYHDFTMTINGRAVTTNSHSDVMCPSTGKLIAKCPVATRQQLDEAVKGALKAQTHWKQTSYDYRREIMNQMSDILQQNSVELGTLLSLENGKPLAEAIREAGARTAASLLGFSSMTIPTPEILTDDKNVRVEVHRRPYGVVGCIIPWNFPLHTLFQKIAPAIYAGNACIVKPSSHTPLSTLRAMELLREITPPGLIQTLAGGSDIGTEICLHKDISKISFTGSTAVGLKVAANSLPTLKRLHLELGGNDAAIVLDDIDNIQETAQGLAKAAFANSGQVCHALKRLYVHESIFDEMCMALAKECEKYKVGHSLEEGVTHGPLTTKEQLEYVRELVNEAVEEGGAKIICGGKLPPITGMIQEGGYYYEPTILAIIQEGIHRIVDEEQFGPVLPVLSFKDPIDAINLANASPMGLTSSVWTRDEDLGYELASRLDCGTAYVNQMSSSHGTTSSVNWPSQGYKMTGMGCNRGLMGLLEFTQPQTVNRRKI